MLGNRVELWEVTLATIKVGAVIIPATTLSGGVEPQDRITRGRVDYVITNPQQVGKLDPCTRPTRGSHDRRRFSPGPASVQRHRAVQRRLSIGALTEASEPLLLYPTSGTTALPKLVQHTYWREGDESVDSAISAHQGALQFKADNSPQSDGSVGM
jgi:acetyl-CoA synthetase